MFVCFTFVLSVINLIYSKQFVLSYYKIFGSKLIPFPPSLSICRQGWNPPKWSPYRFPLQGCATYPCPQISYKVKMTDNGKHASLRTV